MCVRLLACNRHSNVTSSSQDSLKFVENCVISSMPEDRHAFMKHKQKLKQRPGWDPKQGCEGGGGGMGKTKDYQDNRNSTTEILIRWKIFFSTHWRAKEQNCECGYATTLCQIQAALLEC